MTEVTVTISVKDIIWMLENPDKLDFFEKIWIDEFKRLFNEELRKEDADN